MTLTSTQAGLSRRERQILEILYQRGKASASEVLDAMEDAPSNSAVRTLLRVLEEKGHVKRRAEALQEGFMPTDGQEKGKRCAVETSLDRDFHWSSEQCV